MNRKLASGLIISFFILLVLVIISLFIPFGKIASLVYTVFIIELFYLSWFASSKIHWRRKINKKRTLIGIGLIILIVSFYLSLSGLFFNSIIFTVLTYIFFISFSLFVLFTSYRIYGRLNASQRKKLNRAKNFLSKLLNYAFQILLIAFLLFLLIDEFYENIVILNLNYFMIIVIVLGVLSILFPYEEKKKKTKQKSNKYLVYGLAIIGAVLVFFKTKDIGFLSYIIALVSFVLIVLLGYIVYEEED